MLFWVGEKQKPLKGAAVRFESPDRVWAVTSDENGMFTVPLPVGQYKLTIEKRGYAKYAIPIWMWDGKSFAEFSLEKQIAKGQLIKVEKPRKTGSNVDLFNQKKK